MVLHVEARFGLLEGMAFRVVDSVANRAEPQKENRAPDDSADEKKQISCFFFGKTAIKHVVERLANARVSPCFELIYNIIDAAVFDITCIHQD